MYHGVLCTTHTIYDRGYRADKASAKPIGVVAVCSPWRGASSVGTYLLGLSFTAGKGKGERERGESWDPI
jgi:hypothetical protein